MRGWLGFIAVFPDETAGFYVFLVTPLGFSKAPWAY